MKKFGCKFVVYIQTRRLMPDVHDELFTDFAFVIFFGVVAFFFSASDSSELELESSELELDEAAAGRE